MTSLSKWEWNFPHTSQHCQRQTIRPAIAAGTCFKRALSSPAPRTSLSAMQGCRQSYWAAKRLPWIFLQRTERLLVWKMQERIKLQFKKTLRSVARQEVSSTAGHLDAQERQPGFLHFLSGIQASVSLCCDQKGCYMESSIAFPKRTHNFLHPSVS